MTITTICTVFCQGQREDGGLCQAWIGQEFTAADARQLARNVGWKTGRRLNDDDLCAAHRGDDKAGPACWRCGARMRYEQEGRIQIWQCTASRDHYAEQPMPVHNPPEPS